MTLLRIVIIAILLAGALLARWVEVWAHGDGAWNPTLYVVVGVGTVALPSAT